MTVHPSPIITCSRLEILGYGNLPSEKEPSHQNDGDGGDGLDFCSSLFMSGNQIGGTIPSTIGTMSELVYVLHDRTMHNLTRNPSFPHGVVRVNCIYGIIIVCSYLFLSDNQLSGSIPSIAGTLTGLGYVTMKGCQAVVSRGGVPAVVLSLHRLQVDAAAAKLIELMTAIVSVLAPVNMAVIRSGTCYYLAIN